MAAGMVICALGGVLLAMVTSAASVGLTVAAGVLISVGFACNTGPMVAAVVGSVRSDERALAGGANNAARQVGAAIGVAVLGGIAGDPLGRSFLPRLHVAAAVGAAGWLLAAVVAASRMPAMSATSGELRSKDGRGTEFRSEVRRGGVSRAR
jgi:DHA2 family methylenomycin A resistance protein-like MFS transporter